MRTVIVFMHVIFVSCSIALFAIMMYYTIPNLIGNKTALMLIFMIVMAQLLFGLAIVGIGFGSSKWYKSSERLEEMRREQMYWRDVYKAVKEQIAANAVEKFVISDDTIKEIVDSVRKQYDLKDD